MKKYNRQRMILDIIEKRDVKTQDQLSAILREQGVTATQATISRDIKELRITKVQSPDGEYRYMIIDTVHDSLNERLGKIFRSGVLSVHANGNMIIVDTVAFCAQVCGLTITNAKLDNIDGMVAGHDAIFITLNDTSQIDKTLQDLQELMK